MSKNEESGQKSSDKTAEMRTKILDAARDHFFEFGYTDANVDAIAVAAGVSKGSIYRHFPSKGALYFAVLSANSRAFFEGAERHVEDTDALPAAERLRLLWSRYLKHWMRNPTDFEIFWAFDNAEELGELPDGLTDRIAENWTRSLKLTERVIEDGVARGELIEVDSWKSAQAFWTLATTLIEHDNNRARRRMRDRPFHETYEFSIELLIRGLLKDPDASPLEQSGTGAEEE